MKSTITTSNKSQIEQAKVQSKFKMFLFEPFSNGLFGFALFFSILLLTKSLAVFWGMQNRFYVDFDDVLLSLIGFVLLFLIKILENVGRVRG